MNNAKNCVLLAAIAATAGSSYAFTVVTDASQMSTNNAMTDFENTSISSRGNTFSLDGLTFTSNRGMSTVDISLFPVNGTHVEGMALFPRLDGEVRAPVFPIDIDLATPVAQFGFGWFDPNFAGNVAEFYDGEGNLLASVEPTPGPKFGVHADYVGVMFDEDVIAQVRIIPVETSDVFAIDNISWGAVGEPIPAPGTIALAAGSFMLGIRRRRG